MLNYIWLALILIGVAVAALMGRMEALVKGILAQVEAGVMSIALPLAGILMLFLGIMRLAEKSGAVNLLSRLIRPVMRRLFPDVPPDHPAMGAMIMNMAANFLGLGNAATPLGLKAMRHLDDLNPHKGTASNAMCTFLAINTSAITLIPATAIGLLAARGVANPYAIVGTTLVSALCAQIVGIATSKIFQRLPMFRIDPAREASENREEESAAVDGDDDETKAPKLRSIGTRGWVLLTAVGVLFLGTILLETFPARRAALQHALGLDEAVRQLDAAPASTARVAPPGEPALWVRGLGAFSVAAIPFMLLFFAVFAFARGLKVYEEFVEGAREGFQVVIRIMPFLVAMLTALAAMRYSGALPLAQRLLTPVLDLIRFPAELLPMALMRPLSGSGSQGVLADLLTNDTLAVWKKYAAATMYGSTETTFYVLAVYFGSVAIRRTRHALAAGLCADATGLLVAVAICRAFFGA
ncbi:MAG: nucleoside recognition protein [Akkermansiaceae bacterium]|nr:nucleoside recognition protein [Akkermansiaceae bacterium]